MEDKRWFWIAVTAIAPIAWGSTYVVTRNLLPPESPLWGSVLRALPAGLIVLLIARRLPTGSWWWRSLVLGVLNVGGFFVLVYIAGQRLPSSLASTLMSTSAACMLLFAWLLLKRRPRAAAVVGAVVGLVGVGVMLGFDAAGFDVWGVVASLGAMVASSIGFVLTTRWGSDIPALPMTAWQLVGGSLVLVPAALLVEGMPPALTVPSALGFAYVALIGTAVAYVAWFAGLRHLSPGVVGIVGLLNPVTGVLLGVGIAGEVFGVAQGVGIALVLAGIALGALPSRSVRAQPQTVPSTRRDLAVGRRRVRRTVRGHARGRT
ncbi:MAG: EamA family transporter [Microbacterium sp.]